MENGVGRADVAQKLVSETLTLAGSFDDAGDVDELHRGRHDRVRLHHGDDAVHTRIRHGYHAHVGIDGAERIVGGLRLGGGQRVEDGGLADVRQPDDSAVQSHCV